MKTLRNGAAAVTGAASGIGYRLAVGLAARGCDLALADRDIAGLETVAAEIRAAHPVKVTVTQLDVSRRQDVEQFATDAIAAHPRLNLLINNAGVALLGHFDAIELADFEWVMSINSWGVVYGCRAFLPHLLRQPESHIVNVSSVFGLIAPAGQTAYAASKFAVRGFTEALRHECMEHDNPIHVSSVHPGGIRTNIVRNARLAATLSNQGAIAQKEFARVARTSPEQAAERIIQGILRDEPRILIGGDARFIDLLQRLRPATYLRWLKLIAARKRRDA